MSARATGATAARVIRQLRRDPRTIALVIVVPLMLIALFKWVFDGQPQTFDRIGGPLVGIFPLITMFLVTSITMLRERVTGTLERLMTMPLSKLDLLAGYGIAFAAVAAVQGAIVAGVSFLLLGLDVAGSELAVVALAVLNAVLGMALGLLASAFARTEFQAVQFMPAFIFPQLLLCGLFVPRAQMAPALEALSWALPMTYAYDALERVTVNGELGSRGIVDVIVVIAAALLSLTLAALTLRRRTP
ncbi:MAG: ABC transporter permease [Solirubrobacterales bacterium]|nr:MAG: ABC transporter permease [Solirubrobacterales bacterium]